MAKIVSVRASESVGGASIASKRSVASRRSIASRRSVTSKRSVASVRSVASNASDLSEESTNTSDSAILAGSDAEEGTGVQRIAVMVMMVLVTVAVAASVVTYVQAESVKGKLEKVEENLMAAQETNVQLKENMTTLTKHAEQLKTEDAGLEARLEEVEEFTDEAKQKLENFGDYKIHVESAGLEVGNRAVIEVNGKDWALNTRGHNVVVINPAADTITAASFDTWAGRVKHMTAYLNRQAVGSIVILAVKDSIDPKEFKEEEIAAMKALGPGSKYCPAVPAFRGSWALVTKKVKLPWQLPAWIDCRHGARFSAPVTIDVEITALNL